MIRFSYSIVLFFGIWAHAQTSVEVNEAYLSQAILFDVQARLDVESCLNWLEENGDSVSLANGHICDLSPMASEGEGQFLKKQGEAPFLKNQVTLVSSPYGDFEFEFRPYLDTLKLPIYAHPVSPSGPSLESLSREQRIELLRQLLEQNQYQVIIPRTITQIDFDSLMPKPDPNRYELVDKSIYSRTILVEIGPQLETWFVFPAVVNMPIAFGFDLSIPADTTTTYETYFQVVNKLVDNSLPSEVLWSKNAPNGSGYRAIIYTQLFVPNSLILGLAPIDDEEQVPLSLDESKALFLKTIKGSQISLEQFVLVQE
ncbi:MAG: hypothetical protein HRT45_07885 [Bdellovibrionales bacterium]|nr:hypothetical protein [Bdellovibrionales bacterium]